MHIVTENPAEAIELATQYVLEQGQVVAPRGMATKELLNVTIEIQSPWNIPIYMENRKFNHRIGAREALQLVGQVTDPEAMLDAAGVFGKFMDGGILHGAYGPRIHGNLSKVVDLLKKDWSSRQAVLTIFSSDKDLGIATKDVPCTLSLQFFVRNKKLLARTNMRSNDVFLGMPYDFTQFIALQGAVAKALDLEMGTYTHCVGSLHLYEQHSLDAQLIKAHLNGSYKEYEPLWSGDTIDEISQTARMILKGLVHPNLTRFEQFLASN